MLTDLLKDLAEAGDKRDKEKAYRNLERAGMDRVTADVLVAEMRKEAMTDGKGDFGIGGGSRQQK